MGVQVMKTGDQRLACAIHPQCASRRSKVFADRDDTVTPDQNVLHFGLRAGAIKHPGA